MQGVQEMWIWSLGQRIPWRTEWQPIPVFLPGESLWIEEPGRLQPNGLQRVIHDWVCTHTHMVFDADNILQHEQERYWCPSYSINVILEILRWEVTFDIHTQGHGAGFRAFKFSKSVSSFDNLYHLVLIKNMLWFYGKNCLPRSDQKLETMSHKFLFTGT